MYLGGVLFKGKPNANALLLKVLRLLRKRRVIGDEVDERPVVLTPALYAALRSYMVISTAFLGFAYWVLLK